MEERAWGSIMDEKSGRRRNLGRGIMEEEFVEAPRRFPEAPRGTQGAPRRHPRGPRAPRRVQGPGAYEGNYCNIAQLEFKEHNNYNFTMCF